MLDNGKISSRQLIIIFLICTIGDSILVLPTIVATDAKQDAWISGILSLIISMFIVLLYHKVSKMYPQLTLVEYSNKILGRWFGGLFAFLYIGYGLLSVGALLREMGDFLASQIIVETPIEADIALLLMAVIFATKQGVESIARSAEIFIPGLVILFVFLILFLLPQIRMENIQPLMEDGFKPVLKGSITFTAFPFVETYLILMLLPFVDKKESIKKSLLIGAGVGGIILIIITLMTILVLGWEMTSNESYSTYKLATMITAGHIIERVEALLAGIWFITIFFKILLYMYASSYGLAQQLKLRNYKFLTIPLGMITFTVALVMAENSQYLSVFFKTIWPFYDFTNGILFSILLLVVGKWRMNRKVL